MKKFTKSEVNNFFLEFESESAFFKMKDPPGWKQRIIKSYGRYGEKASIIVVEDWVNKANEMIQEANAGKGMFAVTKHMDTDTIEDIRNDLIQTALNKSSKSLTRL